MADVVVNILGSNASALAAINQTRAALDQMAAATKASPLQSTVAINYKAPSASGLLDDVNSYFANRQVSIFNTDLDRSASAFYGMTTGANQVSDAVRRTTGTFGDFESRGTQAGQNIFSAFNLAQVAIATFAGSQIVRAVAGLEQMREESAQIEARFVGFTGGASQATAALDAMNNSVGGALTRDEKMAAATQLMGLGIAKDAQEAAKLTSEALTLGINIETLTRAIETGRANALVPFGISVSDVKDRVTQLQSENSALTDSEARSIAIKEQLAQKSAAVAAAGGVQATATVQLKNAWEDLLDTAADRMNLGAGVSSATEGIRSLTTAVAGVKPETRAQFPVEAEQRNVANIQAEIDARIKARDAIIAQRAEEEKNFVANGGTISATPDWTVGPVAQYNAEIENLTVQLSAANTELIKAKSFADQSGSSMIALGDNAAYAASQIAGIKTPDPIEQFRFDPSKAVQDDVAAARNADTLRWAGLGAVYTKIAQQRTKDDQTAAEKAAKAYEQAMKKATDKLKNDVEGALKGGAGFAKGLFDVSGFAAGNPLAPGANSWAEPYYRLAAVAKDSKEAWTRGMGSPLDEQAKNWMSMYKTNPQEALQAVAAFENQDWNNPAFKKFFDEKRFLEYVEAERAKGNALDSTVQGLMAKVGIKGTVTDKAINVTGGAGATAPLPAAAPVSAAYTVNIQPGAIAVTGATDPATLASKIMSAVVAAFTKAEAAISTPPSPLVAGAR